MSKTELKSAPAVTVIVPVCNVERYLGECLEGLHTQTLKDLEILLVDDGSTDSSPRILAEAAASDPRMRVITKPNGGYGSGINRALFEAKGRYIGIVESDDRVDPHMYEELYQAAMEADEADIVKSSYWEYYDLPGRKPYIKAPNLMNCMPKTSFTANIHEQYELLRHHPSIWTGIYRRAFLEEHGIRMMEEPGGGWVDNPFFFETFLQAESYVWVPAAYYYYRQTNPDSSSNLKNYQMPYDRLRDLRALFQRLQVTDPRILAYFYARHFFYTYSVIGEWGFSEKDPALKELIHEAMAALDPRILHLGNPGISPEYLSYYETVVSDPARRIKGHADACGDPKVSVIVPVYDDRHVLAGTLSQLSRQTMADFEVICVNGDSIDVSREIAERFAEKDARFRVLDARNDGSSAERADTEGTAAAEGYAAAVRTGFSEAKAPVIALIFPGQNVPDGYLKKVVSAMEHDVDFSITLPQAALSSCPWSRNSLVPVRGSQAKLLLCVCDQPSRFAVRRSFLQKAGITVRAEDENGRLLLSDVIGSAGKAAVCFGEAPNAMAKPRASAREADFQAKDYYRADCRVLDSAFEAAKKAGKERQQAFRSMAVHVLLQDLYEYGWSDQGEEIFNDIKERWLHTYGLAGAGRMTFCNMDELLQLEKLLAASYMQMLKLISREARDALDQMQRKKQMFKDLQPVRAALRGYRGMKTAGRKISGEVTKYRKNRERNGNG